MEKQLHDKMCEDSKSVDISVDETEKFRKIIERDNRIISLYERWVKWYSSDADNLAKYLKECGFLKVILYGYGSIGRSLFYGMKNTEIEIVNVIEKNENRWEKDNSIFVSSVEDSRNADCIIVTAINDYNAIYLLLKDKVDCPILSVEDIIP